MLRKILQSYLSFWARIYLMRVKPKIIAITGSVGKTSTKEAIFEVLKYRFSHRVRKTEGNLNTKNGVSLTILGFKEAPGENSRFWDWIPIILAAPFRITENQNTQYLVLEVGADRPGDIKFITSFVKPFIAVMTAIGPAHLEIFKSLENIIEEKTTLFWALESNGWAVMNIDDANVRKVSYGGRYQKITYGIKEKADIVAKDIVTVIENSAPKTKFSLSGQVNAKIISSTLGEKANIYASLAAAAVGNILDVPVEQIKKGLEQLRPEKHRMNVLKGKNDSIIIDDCYNANPLSMMAALNTLESLKAKRKIVVLGDMKELGKIAAESHRLIGKEARKVTRNFITIGNLAKNYRAPHYFKNTDKAVEHLLKEVHSGDIILIKASRSMELEKVIEALKE